MQFFSEIPINMLPKRLLLKIILPNIRKIEILHIQAIHTIELINQFAYLYFPPLRYYNSNLECIK